MLKVLQAGFLNSVQDRGRVGFAASGVPISGVMDSYSAKLANSILNNKTSAAVLEITLSKTSFKFLTSTIICITGADFNPKINDKPIALNSQIVVQKNDILLFNSLNFGFRCYLAVKDGFLTKNILKSRSFYKPVTKQNCLQKGDIIPYSTIVKNTITSKATVKVALNHFTSKHLSCYEGPEYNLLSNVQKKELLETQFSISKNANRMGYQLNEVIVNTLPQILTSAVLPGTVQLTPSGKLIVLMKDCQVTGGYPRVLQLSAKSISELSQKRTGESFFFSLKSHNFKNH